MRIEFANPKKASLNKHKLFGMFFVILLLECLLLQDVPFFWDAISKARRATWFYEHNFSQLILPTEINSGHPPLWPLMLAFFWKLFGRTLFVSHILLLIVNMGVLYQLLLLIESWVPKKYIIATTFLVFLEPTFLAQTTSMNNDMLLLFFTLLAINSIERKRYFFLGLATLGMLFTNLRGMASFGAISLISFVLWWQQGKDRKMLMRIFVTYSLAFLIFFAFIIYHFQELGWAVFTPSKNWSSQREIASLKSIFKNIAIIVFNFSIYGRIVLFLLLSILMGIIYFDKQKQLNELNRKIIGYFLGFTLLCSAMFIPFTNPIGARYFMLPYILSVILFSRLLIEYFPKLLKLGFYIIAAVFITGHFWIFPITLSQPWDASLAYLNSFPVQRKMEKYIQQNKIPQNEIGTRISLNLEPLKYLDSSRVKNPPFASFSFEENTYILLSNIENQTKDAQVAELHRTWNLVKEFNQMGVFMQLFKKDEDNLPVNKN